MSNWDDEEWDDGGEASTAVPGLPVGGVLGDWDDEDASEEEQQPTQKIAPAPMKPKKALEKVLKAREEEERNREMERIMAREKEMSELNIAERKRREQEIVEAADLENAKDLFGVADGGAMAPPAEPTLETFKPETDADFEKFAKMLGDRCTPFNDNPRKTGRYVQFVKSLMRHLIKDLGPDDTKDLAAFMGVLGNEKRDEFKKQKGFKKKANKKTHVKVDRAADMRDNTYDDFADDFM